MSDPPILFSTQASKRPKGLQLAVAILGVISASVLVIIGLFLLLSSLWTYVGATEVFGRLSQTYKDQIRTTAFNEFLAGCGLLFVSALVGSGAFTLIKRAQIRTE